MKDPFATLGLAPDASDREVKKAYRRLALEHHPDRNPGDPEAARRFQAVKEAYDLLSDPDARASWAGGRHPRRRREGPDDDWLDGATWMAEHGWRVAREELLPRFVAAHGVGPRLVWALRQALERGDLAAEAPEVRPTGWQRFRTRRLLRRIRLVVDDRYVTWGSMATVRPGLDMPAVVVHLHEFWRQGAREEDELRPTVHRVVALGLAAAVPLVLRTRVLPEDGAQAAAMDRAERLWRGAWRGVWALVVVLVVVMIGTALVTQGH